MTEKEFSGSEREARTRRALGARATGRAVRRAGGSGAGPSPVEAGRLISELRARQAELERELQHYRALCELSPAGYYFVDAECRYQHVNRAWLDMHGYGAADEVVGKDCGLTHVESDGDAVRANLGKVLGGTAIPSGTAAHRRKDGTVGHHTFSAYPVLKDGKVVGIEGFVVDLSDRKKAEERRRATEERYRTTMEKLFLTLETSGTVVFEQDANLRYVSVFNPHSGFKAEDVLGKTDSELLPADDAAHLRAIKVRALATGQAQHAEVCTTIDGVPYYYALQVQPVCEVTGGGAGVVCASTDITERKRAEERERDLRGQLERAARMESLGVLAGGVAHDLNNMLGPIAMLPDLVGEYVEKQGDPSHPDHEVALEAVQVLKASAQRAIGVVSDLVVMGRRGQFEKEPVDLNDVVEQVMVSKPIVALRAARPDVHWTVRLSDAPAWCMGSASRLMRVLTNLLGNAAEAIEGLGDVRVRVGRRVCTEPMQGFERVPAGDYVTVTVEDTGCGMDAKTLARIFEPFFTTKPPGKRSGSGLGLSVVHGLLRDHGGAIDVKSAPGLGATFVVYLPSAVGVVQGESEGGVGVSAGRERILVVDDEPALRFIAQLQLRKLGYAVTVAAGGDEALALFEKAHREGRPAPFDIVLMDMIMNGLDGLAASQAVLSLYPDQKLMIVSGHAAEPLVEGARALGIGWLAKPYSVDDLARCVRGLLDA